MQRVIDCDIICQVLFLLGIFIHQCHALSCYSCPIVNGSTSHESNLLCLERARLIQCQWNEDRCYSLISGAHLKQIEKGCVQSTACIGSRICCANQDYCNAGLGIHPQTGVRRPCVDIAGCVQGLADMRCEYETTESNEKTCLCANNRMAYGAICRQGKIGEKCLDRDFCADINSRCESSRCICTQNYFPEKFACEEKRNVSQPCEANLQCRDTNSVCDGRRCVCKIPLTYVNATGQCSGQEGTLSGNAYQTLMTVLISSTVLFLYSLSREI